MEYAVIDIETTGGNPKTEKIIEIAIYIHNEKEVIDKFVSFVNPERNVPFFITKLTGINNEMLAGAPKFYEIAKKIVEITENRIFVAHNASFDYAFVKNEFKQLGFDYNRDKLCTVQLSRKYIPGHNSYSLGKICKDLGITIDGRHRAAGDAFATCKLFDIILENAGEIPLDKNIASGYTYRAFEGTPLSEKFDSLPRETGVYYFYDNQNRLIYIGKSKNIRTRVLNHLNNLTKRAQEMKSMLYDVSWELTGSETIALLLEADEIYKHKPRFNKAGRRQAKMWGVYSYLGGDGYKRLFIDKAKPLEMPVITFDSKNEANDFLYSKIEAFSLCTKLCGLYTGSGACFQHKIKLCKGACIGIEPVDEYNKKVDEMITNVSLPEKDLLLIDEGRNPEELSVVKISAGIYSGYGFIDKSNADNIELLKDCINHRPHSKETQRIILSAIKNNKYLKLIEL